MRTAESWVDVVYPAAHLGAEGELERQIKRIQDDAQQDLTAQLAVMVEALKTHGRHINGCPFIANRFVQNEIECTCGYNDLLSNAPLAAKKLLEQLKVKHETLKKNLGRR